MSTCGPRVVNVWVRSGEGGGAKQVAVQAGPTPVPGLVVNEDPVLHGAWAVTHAASGAAIASCLPGPEEALYVAGKLAGICDWTITSREMAVIREEITPRIWDALADAGVLELQPWREPISADRLTGSAS